MGELPPSPVFLPTVATVVVLGAAAVPVLSNGHQLTISFPRVLSFFPCSPISQLNCGFFLGVFFSLLDFPLVGTFIPFPPSNKVHH